MNGEPENEAREGRQTELMAAAQAAVAYSANSLRSIRERFRTAHADQVNLWGYLRDELSIIDRSEAGRPPAPAPDDASAGAEPAAEPNAVAAAEAGAADARTRTVRRDESIAAREAGADASTLARLDLGITSLERIWLLLSRNDASLVMDTAPASTTDIQMRIVEAQEAERTRLAREIHDGPAQALANAIFQVDVVERQMRLNPVLALAELQLMRNQLRRELGDVRGFIAQLRPPILSDLGLLGAIQDVAEQVGGVLGIPIAIEVDPGIDTLPDTVETVMLRIIQEALQNVRRHAEAHHVAIRAFRQDGEWLVEIEDDGRGFDIGAVAARGRRNFGLQFMRERAELIGARFEVRSRPDVGTVVRVAIPGRAEEKTR